MKTKFMKVRKWSAFFVVFIQVFYVAAVPLTAKAVELPIASYLQAATLEEALNQIDVTQSAGLTDDQQRDRTTSEKKINGPQVIVKFDAQNVVNGQKLTAEAMTTGFTKDDSSLYFTWFLKHKGCDLGKNVDFGSQCDPDGDGEVTENDWKVEAMRMIAKGGFDYKTANYSGSKTNDQEKADGFDAYFGNEAVNGNDAADAACYFQDFSSGRIFELSQIQPQFSCPAGSHQQCVENKSISTYQKTDPLDPNQPPLQPTLPMVSEIGKNVCQATTNNNSFTDMADPSCQFQNEDDIDIYKLTAVCDNGSKAVCIPDNSTLTVKNDETTTLGNIFAKNYADSTDCNTATSICSIIGIGKTGSTCDSMFTKIAQTAADAAKNRTTDPNADALAKCDYKKDDNSCKHLFPEPSKGETGDGKFSMEEEQFWGTNPNDPKTAKNQNVDEANVVGLGINKFSWEYRAGDQLGVVVEGTFTKETQHADGTKMVMWALPNNACDDFDKTKDDNAQGFYTEGTKKILAVDFDIDKCLKDNLLDPSGAGKLQVDVTYNPADNLVNDPGGAAYSQGNIVNLKADVAGFSQVGGSMVSTSDFYYNWKIEVSSSTIDPPINADPWKDVTTKFKAVNPGLRMEGIGLNKLEMPLNIPQELFVKQENEIQYIRVKVEVLQNQDSGEGLRGVGTAIIKLKQLDSDKGIKMFPISADADGKLRLLNNDPKKELCADRAGKYLCYVAENEIVGLMASKTKFSNFDWSLNGKPISCSSDMSTQCDSGNIVFFPATATDDGMLKVVLKAKDLDSQAFVTIERYFSLTKPSVAIDSADYQTLTPKLFGFYKDVNGGQTADYSTTVFESAGNAPLKLKALFYPQWKADQSNTEWFINGMANEEWRNKKEIELDPAGMDEINVELAVTYNSGSVGQLNNIRKALYRNWQIAPEEILESNDGANIRIEITDNANTLAAKNSKGFFGAMLTSHLSEELGFMVRLLLTAMMIVFVTGLVFTLIPGRTLAEDFSDRRS